MDPPITMTVTTNRKNPFALILQFSLNSDCDPLFVTQGVYREAGDVEGVERLKQTFLGMMISSDPPDHTRLRSLANKAFTPGVLEGIRSQIQAAADRLLDDVQEQGGMEVISKLAYPLPATVISEILGVADGDKERFKKWSNDLAAFAGSIHEAQENIGPVIPSVAELTELLRETIAARRAEPKDDLLSALVTAKNQGDSFSEDELYSMCVLLIFAGHVTPPLTSLEMES